MAYIVFVNPAILGAQGTGLPVSGVFFAACVAAPSPLTFSISYGIGFGFISHFLI